MRWRRLWIPRYRLGRQETLLISDGTEVIAYVMLLATRHLPLDDPWDPWTRESSPLCMTGCLGSDELCGKSFIVCLH